MRTRGRIVAIDGIGGAAVGAAARAFAAEQRNGKPCVSVWDASGIFGEVQLATVGAGEPSARTLLLLYAADLAYRLRTEIAPALDAGRLVIAAPYVATALAFAHAAGLDEAWVAGMLSFAPRADTREIVTAAPADAEDSGFVAFCSGQIAGQDRRAGSALLERAAARLERPHDAG